MREEHPRTPLPGFLSHWIGIELSVMSRLQQEAVASIPKEGSELEVPTYTHPATEENHFGMSNIVSNLFACVYNSSTIL